MEDANNPIVRIPEMLERTDVIVALFKLNKSQRAILYKAQNIAFDLGYRDGVLAQKQIQILEDSKNEG